MTEIQEAPPRIHWTRNMVRALEDSGVFNGQRYELIEGELYNKMGQTPPHAYGLNKLKNWLIGLFGADHVRIQQPIHVAPGDDEDSEPEPDIAVTKEDEDGYRTRHPGPKDLLLVAEVSDSTLAFDKGTKAALYARAGIVEYWLLDVSGRKLLVHRNPKDGEYRTIQIFGEPDSAATSVRPEESVRVAALLLPPADSKV